MTIYDKLTLRIEQLKNAVERNKKLMSTNDFAKNELSEEEYNAWIKTGINSKIILKLCPACDNIKPNHNCACCHGEGYIRN